jgi:hypothetical protein
MVQIDSETTDGFAWTAVLTEDDNGNPCVGFAVGGNPLGRQCAAADDVFPDNDPVMEYIGTVQQGWDGEGLVFLAVDDASEVRVAFDDGSETTASFHSTEGLPDGMVAAALVGPECTSPAHVLVRDREGRDLDAYGLPTPATPRCP